MYRDVGQHCPRCGADLIDAGSMRACNECRGMWVDPEILYEMAAQMKVPPAPADIEVVDDPRQPLPCPTCRNAMQTCMIYQVPIDVCAKHGIWFDRDELEQVLQASAMLAQPPWFTRA